MIMNRHFKFSCKRQKLLTFMLIGSSLFVCLISQAREFPAVKLPQKEYRLTGTTLQSVKEIVPYYDDCCTIYDSSLYEGEIIVTNEGTAGTQETTTLITYLNGHEMTQEVIDSRIITPAIAREIHVGTKERPDYLVPVSDYVISSYVGPRWGRSHNGIDLAVNTETPVKSSTDGVVIQSGWNGGYGISVYVDCGDGMVIRYGHLSEANVSVGQTVSQGDLLGLSGNTGNSTGPHLHFEMRIHDEVVDPLDYVDLESD